MPELTEQSAFRINEERVASISRHHERMAAAHYARTPSLPMRVFEVPIVAIVGFETSQMARGERQAFSVSATGGESQARIVNPRELGRIIQREICHDRHPVVLELTVPYRARSAGMMGHHWLKQQFPMCTNRNSPVTADRGKEFFSILKIGDRQHIVVFPEPGDLGAMERQAVVPPSRGIGASEEEHQILHDRQRKIIPENFKRKDDEVRVVEKVQVDMRDLENNGFG